MFLKTKNIFGGVAELGFRRNRFPRRIWPGHTFTHIIGQDFSFDPPYGDFAGITYNPLTQNLVYDRQRPRRDF